MGVGTRALEVAKRIRYEIIDIRGLVSAIFLPLSFGIDPSARWNLSDKIQRKKGMTSQL